MKKIFFYLFIFFLPWQTRVILTPGKPEFSSFSIYLSEIFLWLALVFWLTNADLKKIPSNPPFQKGGIGGILFFCFFTFSSILWSPDRVAAFRIWLYIFDGMMVYLFLREHKEMRRGTMKIFLFSMFLAAVFGIWQFFNLSSPAWKWLGLAARGAWNLGDIVVESGGARWLRAYGPFPHPNIFGGYLAAGIVLLFNYWVSDTRKYWQYILGGIFFLALFLTFSRSAWLALATAAIYFLIKNFRKEIIKFFLFLLALAVALSIIFWPMLRTRATSAGRLEAKSNMERVASWRDGLAAWRDNPFFGAGIGQIQSKEPPHNIFILILSQLGLVGFVIYLFLWRGFWKHPAARPLLILFFVIGFFDHYFWTLWPGQAMFWLGISLKQD